MRDTRVLCPKCRRDYDAAGYRPRHIWTRYKEPCDYCGRPGWEFVLS